MKRNKLLLLLALLLTAATGAWATDVYVVGNGNSDGNWLNGVAWDPGAAGNKMTEQNGVYSITFNDVDANSDLQFKFAINGTWAVTYGCTSGDANELNKTLSNIEANGNNFKFGLTEKADVTISFNLSEMTYMISTKGMKVGDDASSAPKHLITAKYRERTRSLEQPLPYATTIGELYEAVSGESFSYLISGMSDLEMPLTGISSDNTSAVSIGELNGASTPVTVIADGKATIGINFSGYVDGIFVSAISPLYAKMKDGVKDADKWTVKVGEGQAQALPIGGLKGDGKETVTLQYTGRLKVKGVKATSDAAPAAVPVTAITLNKTETSIKVGATETLSVTSVLPEEATDKTYTWKTSDETKATVDQDGKVTAVAAGTVTIYAEANDGSGVKGNCTVTVTPATITVTINQSDWGSGWNPSFTKDGVTVSARMIDPHDGNLMDGGTFSTTLGNFTKIVVTAADCEASGTGWSGNHSSMTWAGTPASTVSFSGEFMGLGMTQTTIVCTIEPAN